MCETDLSIYINDSNNKNQTPSEQQASTCYAHAISAIIHMAIHRIKGRQDGYPSLQQIRNKLLQKYGKKGANTQKVLKDVCPQYRLRCKEIKIKEAKQAIFQKRPVIARIMLFQSHWKAFKQFFKNKPNGILTSEQMNKFPEKSGRNQVHSVLLVQYGNNYLRFMNSWGDKWADGGFFKVEKSSVLKPNLIDVYWEQQDLKESEKQYFKKNSVEISKNLMNKFKSLSDSEIQCKNCKVKSLVKEFTGTVSQVKCPKCKENFETKGENLLALAIYLSSTEK